jgi:hypothetical protein
MASFVANPSIEFDSARHHVREAVRILRRALESGHAQQEHGACLRAEAELAKARSFYLDDARQHAGGGG